MIPIAVIDGQPGSGKTQVAQRLGERLGWAVVAWQGQAEGQAQRPGSESVVVEGRGAIRLGQPDARWKFYLTADPAERAHRLGADAPIAAEQELADAAAVRGAEEVVLIDTTGLTVEGVAGMMVAIIEGEWEVS